jgi:hypothetical protein
MKVGILTEIEKQDLEGQLVQPDWYFNPTLDCNENWFISTQEIDNSIYPQNEWVKSLPLIEWCQYIPPTPPPSGITESFSAMTGYVGS